jgi:hypothetical protein
MGVLEARSTQHGLRIQRQKRIYETSLFIDDQVAFKLNRFKELADPNLQN